MSSYQLLKEDGGRLLLETGDALLMDPPILVELSDTLTVLENVFLNNVYNIDEISILENITISIQPAGVSVVDSVAITENTNVLEAWHSSVSDNLSISESFTMLLQIKISVNDSVSLQEESSGDSIRYSSRRTTPRWPNGEIVGSRSLIE